VFVLQCLISLEVLNLSYNVLKEVPLVSTLARNSLTTLDLSNNFLSSLKGVLYDYVEMTNKNNYLP